LESGEKQSIKTIQEPFDELFGIISLMIEDQIKLDEYCKNYSNTKKTLEKLKYSYVGEKSLSQEEFEKNKIIKKVKLDNKIFQEFKNLGL